MSCDVPRQPEHQIHVRHKHERHKHERHKHERHKHERHKHERHPKVALSYLTSSNQTVDITWLQHVHCWTDSGFAASSAGSRRARPVPTRDDTPLPIHHAR